MLAQSRIRAVWEQVRILQAAAWQRPRLGIVRMKGGN